MNCVTALPRWSSAETKEILEAAGGSRRPVPDELAQLSRRIQHQEVAGYEARGGNSTWQSLSRSGSLETDYLNGEVVLQGRDCSDARRRSTRR